MNLFFRVILLILLIGFGLNWEILIPQRQVNNYWTWVYIGKFYWGYVSFVAYVYSSLWLGHGGEVGANAVALAYKKTHLSFWEAFIRGIGCNWLSVWQ